MANTFAAVSTPSAFAYALTEFLDRFNDNPSPELVADEPASLCEVFKDEGLFDAYLASVAAWLCRNHKFPAPAWARGTSRALETPWFASEDPLLKRKYLVHSPTEFRVRNLFVSADALVCV
jgi:hypothetical protein